MRGKKLLTRLWQRQIQAQDATNFLRLILGNLSTIKPYDWRQTLVIAGSSRGGTTWLAEILNTIPNSSILWEPLHLNKMPLLRKLDFDWRTYIQPGSNWTEAEEFFHRVLAGKVLNLWTTSHLDLVQIWQTQVWIVKFCRANLLLRWLTEKFPTRKPILLMRHPCAVVSSQINHGSWLSISPAYRHRRFEAAYPQFRSILNNLQTTEELLAANWCIEYYVPLFSAQPSPWLLVVYERLVTDGERELERIFNNWNIPLPAEALLRLKVPSSTTIQQSNVYKGRNRLLGWQENLSPEQVVRILNVVSAFGLDFYSHEPEPDYERLAAITAIN
ncbi:MAG: hypothetical protein D6756_07505 [Cyanobacteria bacterium J083]|nr:MAG: hypothetical protein D6756_07505 [Cyanobacteria bacterium J083]